MNLRNIFRKSEAALLSLCLVLQVSASCIVASAEGMTDRNETKAGALMETAVTELTETEPEDLAESETADKDETEMVAFSETEVTGLDETEMVAFSETEVTGQDETEMVAFSETEATGQDETEMVAFSETEATGQDETKSIALTEIEVIDQSENTVFSEGETESNNQSKTVVSISDEADFEGQVEVSPATSEEADNIENDVLFNSKIASGYSYELSVDANGESYYMISGYNGEGGDLELPSTHNGIPVTYIYPEIFMNRTDVTSVTIPEGYTNIPNLTFYGCTNLTSVSLPSSIEYIGILAFGNCPKLESVTIHESTEVDIYAFGYSSDRDKIYYDSEQELALPLLTVNKNFIIYGNPQTDAERYANENNFKFIALSADIPAAASDSAGKIDSPATGDEVPGLLWSYLAMLFLSLSGIGLCACHLKHN